MLREIVDLRPAGTQGFQWSKTAGLSSTAQTLEIAQVPCAYAEKHNNLYRHLGAALSGVRPFAHFLNLNSNLNIFIRHCAVNTHSGRMHSTVMCQLTQAKWEDGKLLPKWTNMLSNSRVERLRAAAMAAGYAPAERRTVHSVHLLDRAAMTGHKLSFYEIECFTPSHLLPPPCRPSALS